MKRMRCYLMLHANTEPWDGSTQLIIVVPDNLHFVR